jgi:hypothetical protein
MYVNIEECNAAGLDPKEVGRIARGLERYAKQADSIGIEIFGGSGSGSLRFANTAPDDLEGRKLILAGGFGLNFDGGDGAECECDDGLIRGE